MRIMIIGDPNSVYIYNYIKHVLLDYKDDPMEIFLFSFNSISDQIIRYQAFYRKNHIHLAIPKSTSYFLRKIPKIKGLLGILNSYAAFRRVIRKYGYFDILHIHYVDPYFSRLLTSYAGHFKNVVTTFWGSDLYRVKPRNIRRIGMIISNSTVITVATKEMKDFLWKKYGGNHSSIKAKTIKRINRHLPGKINCRFAQFGLPVLEAIKAIESQESREDSKKALQIPEDKIIVTCGYNAGRAQQHKLMINAINQCPAEIRNQIYVIFPLAYPVVPEYIAELEQYLKTSGFQYCMKNEFLEEINTARLRRASDIMIHSQVTDAFSGSVQEHIFANNIVLNGSWLKYPLLDKNQVYYIRFDNEDDLSVKLTKVIHNLSDEKEKVKENSRVIYQISSWNIVKNHWQALYKPEETRCFTC